MVLTGRRIESIERLFSSDQGRHTAEAEGCDVSCISTGRESKIEGPYELSRHLNGV